VTHKLSSEYSALTDNPVSWDTQKLYSVDLQAAFYSLWAYVNPWNTHTHCLSPFSVGLCVL